MVGFIEQTIADGFTQVVGDPFISGLMFIGFFAAFVMLQGTRLEGKIVVLVPVLFLSLVFAPIMLVIVVLGLAFVIYMVLRRVGN